MVIFSMFCINTFLISLLVNVKIKHYSHVFMLLPSRVIFLMNNPTTFIAVIIWFDVNTVILLADPPGEKLIMLDNLGWYYDVTNVLICQSQIQIVPWNNRN